jgi:hypothetical protein
MSVDNRAALTTSDTDLTRDIANHLKRNFTLGVISGVAFNLYYAVLSTELVMTWFLSELTDSNLLISLLVPIELGSWYFLQLLLSGYVQRQGRTLSLYRLMAVIRIVATAVLAAGTFALAGREPLLVLFMATFAANSVAAGVAALPFITVVAKTIPATRRGMYFGWRRFAGGLLGLSGGVLVKMVLSPDSGLDFPANYGLLFSLGCLITLVLVGSFSLIVEPDGEPDTRRIGLRAQLRRGLRLPRQDRSYNNYLRLRVALVAFSYALPFYAVYARRELGAPDDMVGVYLLCSTLAGVVFNLFSGRVSDRRGNLMVVRLAAITAVLPAILALAIAYLPSAGSDKSAVFALVFITQGLHIAARSIGSMNYLLELAPPIERAIYVGFANGVVGLAVFASPIGGAIVDWLGFEALFLFSLACGLAAVAFAWGLEEPRRKVSALV